ncbi:hypothetical protein SCB49_10977 [unidentified eubacterium SCB49]|nr:hypothetical protein SCB49_10977 [unidentified eubacterium SCB49]
MKVFSLDQLVEADKITAAKQAVSFNELMERSGTQIFNWFHQRLQGAPVPVHVFCGIGNNGGSGLVVSRLLIENGYNVNTYVVNYSDKRTKDFLVNYDRIKNVTKKWPLLMTSEDDFPTMSENDIVIDAMFGTGINRAPEGWVKKLIQYINVQPCFKLAVDVPSGMYADSAIDDIEAVVKVNHTLTFQSPKLAFFLPETGNFTGYYDVLDIGIDREFLMTNPGIATIISKANAQRMYKQRDKFSHKGTFGHTLIVAGAYGSMGAAILSTKGAFRIGAGKVTTLVPECGYTIMQTAVPEAMVLTNESANSLTDITYDFEPTAIAVGMGIGTQKDTVEALSSLFKKAKSSIVIDADAINCISENKALLKEIPEGAILTPHAGELERLVGSWENDYDKLEKVKAFSKKYKVVVVVKGANTITVFEDHLYINTSGNPGMATAGSGDVLSGAIAGLLSQGYDPLTAAIFGVYLHGSAGNIVSQAISYEGAMAGDIAGALGEAFIELFRKEEQAPVEGS